MARNELDEALGLCSELMGWDRETRVPTKGKLVEVGLGWAVTEQFLCNVTSEHGE